MRTWLLTLAALPFACLCVFLAVAVFVPMDANYQRSAHRQIHLHADAQSVEIISSRRIVDPAEFDRLPENVDRDWGVVHVRRNTFEMGLGAEAVFTMYVTTIPHIILLLISSVLPIIALLRWRQLWLRRLNERETIASATPAIAPVGASDARAKDSI